MHPCVGSDAIATGLPCVVRRRKSLELYVSGATSASETAPRSVAHLQMPSHPTGHGANFGHCYDQTAALSGRDCGRPEGSAHRTMRSDRAVTMPDLRGGARRGWIPRGDRSRGDRDFSDGDAFDSYSPNFHPLSPARTFERGCDPPTEGWGQPQNNKNPTHHSP